MAEDQTKPDFVDLLDECGDVFGDFVVQACDAFILKMGEDKGVSLLSLDSVAREGFITESMPEFLVELTSYLQARFEADTTNASQMTLDKLFEHEVSKALLTGQKPFTPENAMDQALKNFDENLS